MASETWRFVERCADAGASTRWFIKKERVPELDGAMATNNKKQTVNYVLGLLGKQRATVERDITDTDTDDFLQYNTMAEMVTKQTNLEQEVFTQTMKIQKETEESCQEIYDSFLESGEAPHLARDKHVKYLNMALGPLPPLFKALDASQPWLYYWICNPMLLLGQEIPAGKKSLAIERLLSMWHEDGGFGGGMGQVGHLAASYAAFLSLALFDDEELWAKIDREQTYKWLMTLKRDDGAFVMHVGGEHDTRASYCALVIASLLDILTPELVEGTADWLAQCQTFEGGFGGVPYDEAHGGYTFCAAAALMTLGKETLLNKINLGSLLEWVTSRQLKLEGGFSGRTNKLVDGCYSFWVGGVVPILEVLTGHESISRAALQNYILGCCQNTQYGGLRDKPSANADFYHTNYVLLGLSVLQSKYRLADDSGEFAGKMDCDAYTIVPEPVSSTSVSVDDEDLLVPLNPVFGLPVGVAEKMKMFFMKRNDL